MVGSGCYKIVSELIPNLDVGVCYFWPHGGCLSVCPRNPMGHNKDIVSAWGHLSHSTLDKGENS